MEYRLLIVPLISFLITYFSTKAWIKIAKKENFLDKDMNKYNHPLIPAYGGIAVLFGFCMGVLFYIALSIFYFQRTINLIEIFALLTTTLIIAFVGFLDDILGWKKGLRKWQKPLLTIPAAIPLMAINAGFTMVYIPFLGLIDIGILYPLIFIPVAIIGASQGFNMLGGLNGLEVGLASIILFTLGFLTWRINDISNEIFTSWIALICLTMFAALIAFWLFNKYPAKVFPGDVLRYALGALIACVAILGNIEKAALILFIPYFIELFIKIKNKLKTECFLIPQEDGSLEIPEKIGSLTHVVAKLLSKIKTKIYEKDIVYSLYCFELILAIIVLSI